METAPAVKKRVDYAAAVPIGTKTVFTGFCHKRADFCIYFLLSFFHGNDLS